MVCFRKTGGKFLLLLTLLAAAPAGALSLAPPQDANLQGAARHAAEAGRAAQAHDFARAEKEWKQVLAIDPHSAAALNNLGMVYYLDHKYQEAEDALRKALQFNRSLTNARVLLGATLVRLGKMQAAVSELEPALRSHLTDSAEKTARIALYEARFSLEEYEQALQALKPLEHKYPDDVDVLYDLGQVHLQLATHAFGRIAAVAPQSYRVHQVIAEMYARQGRYQAAIREYRKALEQRPDLPGAHYEIGLLYLIYNNNEEGQEAARQEFEEELKLNPFEAKPEYRLGRIFWDRHDPPKAGDHFRRAVQLDPKMVDARLYLARVLQAQGDNAGTRQQLDAIVKLDPDNAFAHYMLAQIYRRAGEPQRVREEMAKFEKAQSRGRELQRKFDKMLETAAEESQQDDQPAK
jgi:tetratricopeptide (TPR) repeat protein